MQYVTSVERLKLEQVRQESRLEGLLQGEVKVLKRQLERRFGNLPESVNERLMNANEQELEEWTDAILTAASLEAVFNDTLKH